MTMIVQPKKVIYLLVGITIFLILANLVGLVSRFCFNDNYFRGLIPLFDLNGERNVPSLFSSLLILLCSFFLYIIAATRAKSNMGYAHWMGLAAIFTFLAIDELVSIHERLNEPMREAFHASGILYFAWLIPYAIGVVIIGLIYIRFLVGLPAATRTLMIVSGLIYIAGAVGFELMGGRYFELLNGSRNLLYGFLTSCEESLEMFGMILFAYTLMAHIMAEHGGMCVLQMSSRPIFRLVLENTQPSGTTLEYETSIGDRVSRGTGSVLTFQHHDRI